MTQINRFLMKELRAVYVLRDAWGGVLYIGCSTNPNQRMKVHRKRSWGHLIHSEEVWPIQQSIDAFRMEQRAIKYYEPRFNVRGNEKAVRRRGQSLTPQ